MKPKARGGGGGGPAASPVSRERPSPKKLKHLQQQQQQRNGRVSSPATTALGSKTSNPISPPGRTNAQTAAVASSDALETDRATLAENDYSLPRPRGSARVYGGEGDDGGVSDDEEEDEEDDEGDEELEGEGAGAAAAAAAGGGAPKRDPIYNVAGLHEKLEDFAWSEDCAWVETLAVTHADDGPEVVNVNDDLAREVAFYSQAADGAKEALTRLRDLGLPIVRPKDYYAEMVKGDAHMAKVRARLLSEQKELEEKEERRKARESKKYAKEVQAEKQRERQRAKKEEVQAVEKWRKMRVQSGFAEGGEADLPVELGAAERAQMVAAGMRGKVKQVGGTVAAGAGKGMSKKRKGKNEKFGFGGRKRLTKQNDAMSAADMDGFRPGRGFGTKGEVRGGGAKGKGKQQRPGKARRQQKKGGK